MGSKQSTKTGNILRIKPYHIFGIELKSMKITQSEKEELFDLNRLNHIKIINSLADLPGRKVVFEIRTISFPATVENPAGNVKVFFIARLQDFDDTLAEHYFESTFNLLTSTFDEYIFEPVTPDDLKKYLIPFDLNHAYVITRRVIIDRLDTLKTGFTSRRIGFLSDNLDMKANLVKTASNQIYEDDTILYIFPFSKPVYQTEQFFDLIVNLNTPVLLSVKLQPSALFSHEEEFLEEQIKRCEKFAQIHIIDTGDDTTYLNPTLQELARAYQRNLIKFLFGLKDTSALMTIEIYSQKPLSDLALNSIASFITAPAGSKTGDREDINEYLSGGCEIFEINPSPHRFNLLDNVKNLLKSEKLLAELLNLNFYDHPLLPAEYRRLLHIFSPEITSFAFKFPPPPYDVLPSFDTRFYEQRLTPLSSIKTGCLVGLNIYKSTRTEVRITSEDRKRHIYIIGQTGTGKTTLLKTMILDDIRNGNGLCVIDPHGDMFKEILGKIPRKRIDDVVIFDPTDIDYPVGFNPLEYQNPESRYFIVQEFVGIIRRLLQSEYGTFASEISGPIFYQHVQMNLLLIMSDPDKPGTLFDFYKIYQSRGEWKKWVPPKLPDPLLQDWIKNVLPETDYLYSTSDGVSLGTYISSKFRNFIFDPYLRYIFAQRRTTVNFSDIMNSGKILLVNLAKGELTEENSRFLGMLIMTELMTSAMERVKIPPSERKEFYIYVDEFQSIATNSFTTLLSEARKFGISLILANQFIEQIEDKTISQAIFGNVGTIICFRLGQEDAERLEKRFYPYLNKLHLTNLPNWHAYMTTLLNGQSTVPFNIQTIPDKTPYDEKIAQAVREQSRRKYARPRKSIEDELNQELSSKHSVLKRKENKNDNFIDLDEDNESI